MKVSIVTVCFNSASTIRDTIESVLSQTYSDIEYVVVDGGSNDKTLDIIREYDNQIAKYVSEPDKGIYDAMNKGVSLTTGDVVGILNSDDFYESDDVVEFMAKQFSAKDSLDMIFGDVLYCDATDKKRIVRHYGSSHFSRWKLRFGWMPPHAGTFIKRSAYRLVGLYSLEYKIASDYELFVRMLITHKLSYGWTDKVLVRMRQGGVSTGGIKSSLLLNMEIVRACKTNGMYTNILFVLSKIPFKLLELYRLKPVVDK